MQEADSRRRLQHRSSSGRRNVGTSGGRGEPERKVFSRGCLETGRFQEGAPSNG